MKKIIFVLFLMFIYSCNYSPGSYPYAEIYKVELPEQEIIKRIHGIIENNPELKLPKVLVLKEGRESEFDKWYHMWVFDKKNNEIYYLWIRGSEVGLVSINKGQELGNWERVNKDLNGVKNNSVKTFFYNKIISEL